MSPLAIAWKSVRSRGAVTLLTALSVALGVMLVVAVLVTGGVLKRTLSRPATPFDLIIGPKGSDLQLVLSSVYRMPAAIEPMPYPYYQELLAGMEDPAGDSPFRELVPIAFGDATEEGGFPIVATIGRYFRAGVNRDEAFRLTEGSRGFEGGWDAIVGSEVARVNGWGLGDTFKLVHGGAEGGHVHDEEFTIVGVLRPTGTPNDKTAFVQLNGFYAVSGHEKPLSEAVNRWEAFNGRPELSGAELAAATRAANVAGVGGSVDMQKEVSAIFALLKGTEDGPSMAPIIVAADINEGFKAAAVNPAKPVRELRETLLSPAEWVLAGLSALIVVVAGVGVFVSLYTTLSERLREVAVLRALGAQRGTVFLVVLLEAVVVTLLGGVLGFVLGHGLVFLVLPFLPSSLVVDPWTVRAEEAWVLPGLLALAALAGLLPAARAYKADVARHLG